MFMSSFRNRFLSLTALLLLYFSLPSLPADLTAKTGPKGNSKTVTKSIRKPVEKPLTKVEKNISRNIKRLICVPKGRYKRKIKPYKLGFATAVKKKHNVVYFVTARHHVRRDLYDLEPLNCRPHVYFKGRNYPIFIHQEPKNKADVVSVYAFIPKYPRVDIKLGKPQLARIELIAQQQKSSKSILLRIPFSLDLVKEREDEGYVWFTNGLETKLGDCGRPGLQSGRIIGVVSMKQTDDKKTPMTVFTPSSYLENLFWPKRFLNCFIS